MFPPTKCSGSSLLHGAIITSQSSPLTTNGLSDWVVMVTSRCDVLDVSIFCKLKRVHIWTTVSPMAIGRVSFLDFLIDVIPSPSPAYPTASLIKSNNKPSFNTHLCIGLSLVLNTPSICLGHGCPLESETTPFAFDLPFRPLTSKVARVSLVIPTSYGIWSGNAKDNVGIGSPVWCLKERLNPLMFFESIFLKNEVDCQPPMIAYWAYS